MQAKIRALARFSILAALLCVTNSSLRAQGSSSPTPLWARQQCTSDLTSAVNNLLGCFANVPAKLKQTIDYLFKIGVVQPAPKEMQDQLGEYKSYMFTCMANFEKTRLSIKPFCVGASTYYELYCAARRHATGQTCRGFLLTDNHRGGLYARKDGCGNWFPWPRSCTTPIIPGQKEIFSPNIPTNKEKTIMLPIASRVCAAQNDLTETCKARCYRLDANCQKNCDDLQAKLIAACIASGGLK